MCIEAAEKELPLDAIIWRSLAPALAISPPRANGHADADADAGGDSSAWDLVQKALVQLFTTSVLVRLRVQAKLHLSYSRIPHNYILHPHNYILHPQ